jgi:hypothetical protein
VQCARALSPDEQIASRILLTAERALRRPDGSVVIQSQAGSLLLRRPPAALANPRGNVPSARAPAADRRLALRRGERAHPPARRSHGAPPAPLDDRVALGLRQRSADARRRGRTPAAGGVDPFPVCERGRSEAEQAIGRLVAGPIDTVLQRSGRLTLTGSGVTARLVPLT